MGDVGSRDPGKVGTMERDSNKAAAGLMFGVLAIIIMLRPITRWANLLLWEPDTDFLLALVAWAIGFEVIASPVRRWVARRRRAAETRRAVDWY